MADTGNKQNIPADALGRALHRAAFALTVAGGTMLMALVTMVVVSILGRSLLDTPIYGDFELVAIGTGIAVSLFLPYCHLSRGNVLVDLFLAAAPPRVRLACDAASSLLLAALAALLTWRTVVGMLDMIAYREVSIILAIPVWWAFPFVIASLALLALSALYTAWRDGTGLAR